MADTERAGPGGTRTVGHCIVCDRFVERTDGTCPAGHGPELVSGEIHLAAGEDLPEMPPFNLAAFLIPPVWGAWYRQWFALLFFALWFFTVRAVQMSFGRGWVFSTIAVVVVLGTLAFQFVFARRANALAWRRMCGRQTFAHFVRDQAYWAGGAAVVVALAAAWIAARAMGWL